MWPVCGGKMSIDLSPEAITRRLELVAELRRLCLELGRARPGEGHEGQTPAGGGRAGALADRSGRSTVKE